MPVLQRITNPLELSSNFVLSVEANNLDGYNINDPVTTWVDNSGVGNNGTQTTTANKPLFVSHTQYTATTESDITQMRIRLEGQDTNGSSAVNTRHQGTKIVFKPSI